MKYKTDTPILIIAFNRPDTLIKVLEAVKKVSPSKLYIAVDGPRVGNNNDALKCSEVKALFDNINWCDNVNKLYRENNYGCKENVSKAIDWAFENEEKLIILEDDLIPSSSFFRFCDELLEFYNDNEKIHQICGYNILQKYCTKNQSYYFSNYPVISGWATWKRAWKNYDPNLTKMSDKGIKSKILNRYKKKRHGRFRYRRLARSYKMACNGTHDSWASAWVYSILVNGGISIMPSVNLVRNIGFGEDAHNKGRYSSPFSKPYEEEMSFPLLHPQNINVDKDADAATLEVHFTNGYPKWYVYGSIAYNYIFPNGTKLKHLKRLKRRIYEFATKKEK